MIGAITAGLFSTGAAAGGGTSYESIATVNVGSGGQSTISFTSIPSTYKHLQIRAIAKSNWSGNVVSYAMTLNGDSGANYSYHELYGSGTAAAAAGSASTSYMYAGVILGNSTASTWGAGVIDLLDYADTNKYKTSRVLTGADINGTGGYVELMSSSWRNTSAVNSITLSLISGYGTLFSQYSSFALYGIKG